MPLRREAGERVSKSISEGGAVDHGQGGLLGKKRNAEMYPADAPNERASPAGEPSEAAWRTTGGEIRASGGWNSNATRYRGASAVSVEKWYWMTFHVAPSRTRVSV